MIFSYKFSREPNTKIIEKMDFHPLQVSPLPRKDQDLQEYINVVPEEYVAIEDHLENPNFQLHVREIIKVTPIINKNNLHFFFCFFVFCFFIIFLVLNACIFYVLSLLCTEKGGRCGRKSQTICYLLSENCFKDGERHLLGAWILGKINPTNSDKLVGNQTNPFSHTSCCGLIKSRWKPNSELA